MIGSLRIRPLNQKALRPAGPVLYWMSRDQRVHDNWALLFSQQQAREARVPLSVVFCLVPDFLGATWRQYDFMLIGLRELAATLEKYNIGFQIVCGAPEKALPRLVRERGASCLVMDFDPLRIKRQWKQSVSQAIAVPAYEVDSHNIVPCWHASPKQEYGAYTLRPKIQKMLADFLCDFPRLGVHPHRGNKKLPAIDWQALLRSVKASADVPPVDWLTPGEAAAKTMLQLFLRDKLAGYDEQRNDPTKDGQSNLSPYLHFGQLSAQRVALTVSQSTAPETDKQAFLEELIVRRELSDNFCYYAAQYDTMNGFPSWAQKTHKEHAQDKREYIYTLAQLEKSQTHDELWNACQRQMVLTGKMHGYMRMYWAKKILEWTPSAATAMRYAIFLNDRYELDGRDPNGYAGIAWSIGGVHDRAWFERSIFGKIRYMSYNGCKSKFDVQAYIDQCKMEKSKIKMAQTRSKIKM